MSRRTRIPNLGGATAYVLHRPHPTVQTMVRQLSAIGLTAVDCWPELPPAALSADFVFFDVDLGFDEQFPWQPGDAPMPLVALIGSEAPGRIEWALFNHGANAHLLKPVGTAGVYSSLLIARQNFEERKHLAARIDTLQARVAERHTVVRAVAALAKDSDYEQGFARLRSLAMNWRVNVEEAASRVVAMADGRAGDGNEQRNHA
ncbi:ANTAR domain-containing protein [Aquamicrobium lusatiense]|uniref:ANTAR domain-containing response regulator n=1 Tax=Aquamicrobium lusatiense TaxID=89772 RepID=UPI002454E0E6|nr:ANTAR domain-containing protein [Aquamicrobium lusatiense]MDH4989979.1 ANTAR domain-containing protein [Aquamicrobium lusatiense]